MSDVSNPTDPTQEQIQVMVDIWRVWASATPGLRDMSVNGMMKRAYTEARAMEGDNAKQS